MSFRSSVAISFLIMAISLDFQCSRSFNEKEPDNNTRKLALKLEPGQKLSGSYHSQSDTDVDYVYMTVESPSMIVGQLGAVKGVDSEILFFRKGEIVPFKVVNDNQSSLNERFGPYLVSPPGAVIAIRPKQNVNDEKYSNLKYQFYYDILSPPEQVEQESNDTPELANSLEKNIIRGFYNNALGENDIEKDYYFIDIPENQKYRLSAKLSKVTGVDGVIRLYSKDGEKLLTIDNGAMGEEENIFSYGVQGPTKLYFSINAKDYKISESEYYELSAEIHPYEEKYELEPNDSIREATPVKVNKIFGDFSNDQDVDYYRYYNESFDTVNYFAEVVPSSDFDVRLELYPGINSSSVIYDDGGSELSEGVSNWIVKPLETIYFKVSKKSLGKTGAYTLNTASASASENLESEPNDSIKTATVVTQDKIITGYVNPGKDQDYYVIRIATQNKYTIDLESLPECRMSVSVLDPKGIKTEGKTASASGENIQFSAILDPGSYILVSGDNVAKPMYKNNYRLRIFLNEQTQ